MDSLTLGGSHQAGGANFTGLLDEFRIYNTSFNVEQARAIYYSENTLNKSFSILVNQTLKANSTYKASLYITNLTDYSSQKNTSEILICDTGVVCPPPQQPSSFIYNLYIQKPTTLSPNVTTVGSNITIEFNFSKDGINQTLGMNITNVTIGGKFADILNLTYQTGGGETTFTQNNYTIYYNFSTNGNGKTVFNRTNQGLTIPPANTDALDGGNLTTCATNNLAQSDNSYWVNDPGNFRVQHYNSSNVFVNRVMNLGSTYSVYPDKNNINRIFAGYLEFSTDYTTLTGGSGWALINNWGATVSNLYDGFGQMRFQTTLSNGRTYGMIRTGDYYEIVELIAGGQTRFTGVLIALSKILCDDGSLQDYTESGGTATLRRYPLSGFSSNNPTWSSTGEVLAILPYGNNPVTYPNSQAFSGHRVAFFNYNSYQSNSGPVYTTGYHLSGSTRGSSSTLFNTEKSTHRNYEGGYPGVGWFDVGNGVNNYAGGSLSISGDNIFTSYHGEFWKNGQTNKYNHYYKNGLAIGQFGATRYDVGFTNHAASGMAGNALTPVYVSAGTDSGYLYHGDESDHSALHRWKISGLNTIAEQSISVAFPSAYVAPALGYTDLMTSIPFDATFSNIGAWSRFPSSGGGLTMNTSRFSYDHLKDKDVSMSYSNPNTSAVTDSVKVSLGSNNVTTNWKISGNIAYPVNAANYGPTAQYFEVLDAAGKVLTTFYPIRDLSAYPSVNYRLKGNTLNLINITETSSTFNEYLRDLKAFEIICIGGAVTFNYGGYTGTTTILDGTGNWRTPASIRFRFTTTTAGGSVEGANVTVQNLKLYKDY